MAEQSAGYFQRSWNDLKQDKRWWQPVLILSLVNMVPIIGQLITAGYLLDWGKEAAWGIDKPLYREVGSIGKRLKYGFFAFLILFVWNLIPTVVGGILSPIPIIGGLVGLVCSVLAVAALVVGMGGVMRMLVYDTLAPGFHFKRVFHMAREDAGGLWRIFGIEVIACVIIIAVIFVVIVPMGIVGVAQLIMEGMSDYSYSYDMHGMYYSSSPGIAVIVLGMVPGLLVLGLVVNFISTLFNAIVCRSFGHWTAQFSPENWGSANSDMPFEKKYVESGAAAAAAAPVGASTDTPVGASEASTAPSSRAERSGVEGSHEGNPSATGASAPSAQDDGKGELSRECVTEGVDASTDTPVGASPCSPAAGESPEAPAAPAPVASAPAVPAPPIPAPPVPPPPAPAASQDDQ